MRMFRYAEQLILALILIGCNSQAAQEVDLVLNNTAIATFAGGCFWCMEPPYDKLEGVISTVSGYTGGRTKNPDYKMVSSGRSGHAEVVKVTYDPDKLSYEKLLEVFWRNIDPTRKDGQFCDRGSQYRPAIYYHDQNQQAFAELSKAKVAEIKTFSEELKVEISKADEFYAAEDYHQDYYQKNPVRYKYYRYACGRDKRLKELWGDSVD